MPRKVSNEQVREIRERYAADPTLTHAELGKEYGVSGTTCSRFCRGDERPEAGGPFSFGQERTRPFIQTDSDISYSHPAAAGWLGVRVASIREYLHRGLLERTGAGLITLDSLERYHAERWRPKTRKFKRPVTRCERCGLLDHVNGLCWHCRHELNGGSFVLYGAQT